MSNATIPMADLATLIRERERYHDALTHIAGYFRGGQPDEEDVVAIAGIVKQALRVEETDELFAQALSAYDGGYRSHRPGSAGR